MGLKLLSLFIFFISCSLTSKKYSQDQIKDETKRINAFFERVFKEKVSRYPTWLTYMGEKRDYHKLDNETEEYGEEDFENSEKYLEELREFNYDALSEQGKISYRIFELQTERDLESKKWMFHSFPLNQMFGFQSTTPSFMINMHRVSSVQDAKDYISRLKEFRRVFSERLTHLRKQELKGIIPPKFVFPKVLADSKNIISGAPFEKSKNDSPLFADIKKKINALKVGKPVKTILINDAKVALVRYVLPSYKGLISFAKELQKKATGNYGAWKLPDGEDYYNYKLKVITTTNLKAEEIHNIGLREVTRIHNEMKLIKDKVGFKGSLKEFFDYMRGNKKFLYPQNGAGKKAYLRDTNKLISQMKTTLPSMFNTFPKAKLEVKAVEPFREKSAGIAFYSRPSLDGKRPGIYYVNLYKMEDNPKYKMEALAYHEALPGHHMQLAIANELTGLPTFRRSGGFTAYIEGWGLYSELLPKEFGFYQDPYSDFGRLSMELWRACRLVVDTGIHSKRWSREKAIAYLKDNTPNADLEIMKGIERYFVMPGQAVSYKIGMMKILELREYAKSKLKDKFDIKAFHDVVLRSGALPLGILEEQVNLWIKTLK